MPWSCEARFAGQFESIKTFLTNFFGQEHVHKTLPGVAISYQFNCMICALHIDWDSMERVRVKQEPEHGDRKKEMSNRMDGRDLEKNISSSM